MAQLVKLYDYISRYEKDIYHYPSQFIRLKKENWKKLYQLWESQKNKPNEALIDAGDYEKPKVPMWKRLFKRTGYRDDNNEHVKDSEEKLPETETALKHYFLNALFPFQLKWGSTTIHEMSFLDRQLYDDYLLKYFLARFPDTFLLFYYPVFTVKNNPLEGDLIFVTPVGIEIIRLVEFDSSTSIIVGDDRTWLKQEGQVQTRMISPMISLKRTEKVVKGIMKNYDVDFPIRRVVLSRTNDIGFQSEPFNTMYVGKAEHEQWLISKRTVVSPLKHDQLKICEALLKHCSSISVKRPEWDEDTDPDQYLNF